MLERWHEKFSQRQKSKAAILPANDRERKIGLGYNQPWIRQKSNEWKTFGPENMQDPRLQVHSAPHGARPRKPIAFLTMECLDGFVAYDHLAIPPLARRGWDVVDVPWTRKDVQWSDFEAVIIRTPWDYHHRISDFLAVIDQIDQSSARLINSAEIVRWNIDKSYLKDLQNEGLPIVPTQWREGIQWQDVLKAFDLFDVDEVVLKPTIGAGARDTFRIKQGQQPVANVEALYQNRTAMLQPFLPSVVQQGEWSLFYFGGTYSHAVLKTPAEGDFRVQEEYGSNLQAVIPSEDLLEVAQRSLRVIGETLVYARIDLVRLVDSTPAIMELELIEPSLYFPYEEASPDRFAEAIDHCLTTTETTSGIPLSHRVRTERPGTVERVKH